MAETDPLTPDFLAASATAPEQPGSDDLPDDPKTFLERVKTFDFDKGDVVAAATLVGAGLAIVAGLHARRNLGNRVRTPQGEEVAITDSPAHYMKGVASIVRLADGAAASFPTSPEVVDQLRGKIKKPKNDLSDIAVFVMPGKNDAEKGMSYPFQEGIQEHSRYRRAAKWAAGIVTHALSSLTAEKSDPEA